MYRSANSWGAVLRRTGSRRFALCSSSRSWSRSCPARRTRSNKLLARDCSRSLAVDRRASRRVSRCSSASCDLARTACSASANRSRIVRRRFGAQACRLLETLRSASGTRLDRHETRLPDLQEHTRRCRGCPASLALPRGDCGVEVVASRGAGCATSRKCCACAHRARSIAQLLGTPRSDPLRSRPLQPAGAPTGGAPRRPLGFALDRRGGTDRDRRLESRARYVCVHGPATKRRTGRSRARVASSIRRRGAGVARAGHGS